MQKNRTAKQEADDLRANRNKLSKQIGALMGQGKKEEAEEVKKQVSSRLLHVWLSWKQRKKNLLRRS